MKTVVVVMYNEQVRSMFLPHNHKEWYFGFIYALVCVRGCVVLLRYILVELSAEMELRDGRLKLIRVSKSNFRHFLQKLCSKTKLATLFRNYIIGGNDLAVL